MQVLITDFAPPLMTQAQRVVKPTWILPENFLQGGVTTSDVQRVLDLMLLNLVIQESDRDTLMAGVLARVPAGVDDSQVAARSSYSFPRVTSRPGTFRNTRTTVVQNYRGHNLTQ